MKKKRKKRDKEMGLSHIILEISILLKFLQDHIDSVKFFKA